MRYCRLAIIVADVTNPKHNRLAERQRDRRTIAANVRAEMGRHNMKTATLARLLGIDQSTLSRKTREDPIASFNGEEIVAIARILGVTPSALLAGSHATTNGGAAA